MIISSITLVNLVLSITCTGIEEVFFHMTTQLNMINLEAMRS